MDTEWLEKNAEQLIRLSDGLWVVYDRDGRLGEGNDPNEAVENAKLNTENVLIFLRVGL